VNPTVRALSALRGATLAALALLGGCAALPASGPSAGAIVSAARAPAPGGFPIIELTPELAAAPVAPAAALSGLTALPQGEAVGAIGPGDVLQITVFEVGAALFAPAATGQVASAPGAAGQTLPPIVVGADGAVMAPYVGRIAAAGLTPEALAERIEAALAGKSQAPQVVVSVREPLASTVMVMGDVRKPGRVPLTAGAERVLDALALAGGAANPTRDDSVRLLRGGSAAEVPLADLQAGSAEDVALRPHDRLEVIYRPRTLTIFGAAGKVQEIPFAAARLSLAEALARAGGPSEQLADPGAVFVFRYEPANLDGTPAADARPVAYRLNMRQAQSYFVSQRFEMRNRDVLYIAGAEVNQPAKLLQILNLMFQPIYTAKVVAR